MLIDFPFSIKIEINVFIMIDRKINWSIFDQQDKKKKNLIYIQIKIYRYLNNIEIVRF